MEAYTYTKAPLSSVRFIIFQHFPSLNSRFLCSAICLDVSSTQATTIKGEFNMLESLDYPFQLLFDCFLRLGVAESRANTKEQP